MNSFRRKVIDLVVSELASIPGVLSVESDDYDSHSVNIFINLLGNGVDLYPLRRIKSIISSICVCRYLSQPIRRYNEYGVREYDSKHIKIEAYL